MNCLKFGICCVFIVLLVLILGTKETDSQETESKRSNSKMSDKILSTTNMLKRVISEMEDDEKVKKGTEDKEDNEDEKGEDDDEDYQESETTAKDKRRESKDDNKGPKIWDQWSKWSSCSVTCGIGKITRWRHCVSGGCSTGEKEAQIKTCTLPAC